MHPRKILIVLFIVFFLTSLMFSTSLAFGLSESSKVGAHVEITAEDAKKVTAVGANVTIRGTVKKNVWATGANVDIDTVTGNDVYAFGAQVDIKGTVGGAARVGGAEVNLDAQITEAVNAYGAEVLVSENTTMGDDSSVKGALVEFNGSAGDDLELYGDEVIFNGQAKGSVSIEGRNVQIADTADIAGDLNIRSVELADISNSATVAGTINQEKMTEEEFSSSLDNDEGSLFKKLKRKFIIGASAFLLGLLMLLATRNTSEHMMTLLRQRPGTSLVWGLATFFGLPLAAIILMVVVLGLPLGLTGLLTLPFLILLGFTSALLGLSDWLLSKTDKPKETQQRVLYLLLAILIYIVIRLIPVAGGLIVFVAMLFGLGAFVLSFGQRLKDNKSKQTPLTIGEI